MLTNSVDPSFNQMRDLLLFMMEVHINEFSMANILSFVEVANISGVHIKMDTSNEKLINVHIKYGKIIDFN